MLEVPPITLDPVAEHGSTMLDPVADVARRRGRKTTISQKQ